MARDAIQKDVIKAFLGDDTEFKGLLTFEGTVRIDGKFEGEIVTEDNLIIGEKAHIRAEIKVGSVLIQGTVEGNIHASKKVQISNKGKLIGNIHTAALQIEDGAVLEGSVSMMRGEEKKLRVLPGKKDALESVPRLTGLDRPEAPAASA
ncbi:MAG: polymer-forming cytoskeletal protein [Nitrospinae bacterium]|nr:polymer-forming cytoskeletal protein [Nitrospinota bacterium]